jgi:nicotinate-nucleotide--dimethylbenzimidazole phosphoribosyltransferase
MFPHAFSDRSSFLKAIAAIPTADETIRQEILLQWDTRTKPPGSLGRLETIAAWVGAVQGRPTPQVHRMALRLFAGAHGITAEGVSLCPDAINGQMLRNFRNGGAGINAICRSNGIDFAALDAGIDHPTQNFLHAPAMSETETLDALALGWTAVPSHAQLFAVGEMGIGNTTPAAAIIAAITGQAVASITGRGAGLTDELFLKKQQTLTRALENRRLEFTSPLAILASVGGREIAAMTGAILGAAARSIPVVLDGVIAGAAAAIAFELQPRVLAKCIAGHCSAEPAHRAFLSHYGLDPILDLGMRLGEGTGAAVAMGVIRNAVDAYNHMATFEQAGVVL